jgi:hypothetical protein
MATDSNSRSAMDKATEVVIDATAAVQATSETIAGAIEDSRRPGGIFNQVARTAHEAPLRSLAIAFLAGLIAARAVS